MSVISRPLDSALSHLETIVFALITLLWVFQGVRAVGGLRRLPHVRDAAPLPSGECPGVTLIFAARDEAEKLPAALESMLALDYPRLELIAVNDRSTDSTGAILDAAAQRDPRLRVVHVRELPPGWLGKTNALHRGAELATGEWLLFTDADVHFAPDVLRRSLSIALREDFEHLTLLASMIIHGFWEKIVIPYFGLGFVSSAEPWRVADSRSGRYMGVGAFQLVRRSAYNRAGGHTKLALEVIDDMKLGKILKQFGARSGVAFADDSVRVRWHAGLGNLVRGVEKNFFAGCGYNLYRTAAGALAVITLSIVPFFGVIFAHGWARFFAATAALAGMTVEALLAVAVTARVSPFYALFQPLAAAIFNYMIARSVFITLWQGGVTWRGTFYPLDELKRHVA